MTTKNVAKVLGVSESSVKRWIDDGLLKAEKTPGGHRRVSVSDLDQFIQTTGKKVKDKSRIGVPDSISLETFSDIFKHFSLSLRNGDVLLMRAIIRKMMLEGNTIDVVIDRLVFPAFKELRSKCAHPSEECLVLHRATDMIRHILDLQNQEVEADSVSKIVLADLGYDIDGLPTFLAEASVRGLCSPVQLGTSVPEEVVVGSLDRMAVHAVFLSASGPVRNRKLLEKNIESITSACLKKNVPCFLYGEHFEGRKFSDKMIRKVNSFSELRGAVNH